jgi:pimeloyl-ACP methyl ester carboxylesterase
VLLDLVQTTTRDGVRLDGSFQSPSGPAALPVDALCCVHGTGSNFYSSTLFDAFAEHFLPLGCAILRVNTRGHDGISTAVTDRGGRRLGAAYEVVDDCRHDIVAWVEWLKQKVGTRIALVGHSLGAVKCIYTLAHEARLEVACLAAVSPPRLSYAAFCTSADGPAFLETYTQAERHIANGRPMALLDVKLPLPFVITAAGFVEKYGPDERYNYLRILPSVSCPTLITLGATEVENNMAFRGAPEELTELGRRRGPLTVETIAGADHFYTGVRADLLVGVERWLRSLAL